MPLFKKSLKKEQKQLLQEKLRIAQEKPDTIFDLSVIGIKQVPDGVYAKCKILNKQALMLQHNLLADLKGGGDLSNLSAIVILDVSHNCLTSLPKPIQYLSCLQKLNAAHNKIKKIPEQIGLCKELQVFDISHNELPGLPPSIKNFRKLESLDISGNRFLTNLPANICYLENLEDFKYDVDRITYPPKDISRGGLKEIQRWFKKVKGDENFDEDEADCGSFPTSPLSSTGSQAEVEDKAFEEAILERERLKQKKHRERLKLEQEILDSQTENAILLANAQHQRQEVLSQIEKDKLENDAALARKFSEDNQERNKLLEQLYLEENHLEQTVNLVLQMSERARQTDELLEELEREQSRLDSLIKVTQEETDRLRKQEMIDAMNYLLAQEMESERTWNEYERQKQRTLMNSKRHADEDDMELEQKLREREEAQEALLQEIVTEEEKQREAFQMLQFQKDAKLSRIKKQVDMIQSELAKLSLLEMEKRKERNEQEVNALAEMRVNTAILLSQLIDQQEEREIRLKETINQMEVQREGQAQDYWLIQFQRLLDSKPQVLVDAENRLDVFVVETLLNASAKEYLPHFARHKVDEIQLFAMTKERLHEIGVKDEMVKANIMSAVKEASIQREKISRQDNMFPSKKMNDAQKLEEPSAPPVPQEKLPSQSVNVISESECVVCLDRRPEVVLLTCGHVCVCATCSQPLVDCPLCRQKIIQKCRLFGV